MQRIQKGMEEGQAELICNCCGRSLKKTEQVLLEDVCSVRVQWGYFSRKDGENHSFELCEECYDRITQEFVIPPRVEQRTEIF